MCRPGSCSEGLDQPLRHPRRVVVGSDCGACIQTGTGKCGERYRGVNCRVQPIQRSGAGAPGPSQEGLDYPHWFPPAVEVGPNGFAGFGGYALMASRFTAPALAGSSPVVGTVEVVQLPPESVSMAPFPTAVHDPIATHETASRLAAPVSTVGVHVPSERVSTIGVGDPSPLPPGRHTIRPPGRTGHRAPRPRTRGNRSGRGRPGPPDSVAKFGSAANCPPVVATHQPGVGHDGVPISFPTPSPRYVGVHL